jgi:acetyltransferase-like isoleucine patch superfamily enzyme
MLKHLFKLKHEYGIWKLKKCGLSIGTGTLIFNEAEDYGCRPELITIDSNCVIASGVRFISNPALSGDFTIMNKTCKKGIVIHDNCFIGMDSIIYPNVQIGPNSIVGAGAVVTGDVLPNTCVIGNTARVTCTIDTYIRICEKNIIKGYNSCNKKEILEKLLWECCIT